MHQGARAGRRHHLACRRAPSSTPSCLRFAGLCRELRNSRSLAPDNASGQRALRRLADRKGTGKAPARAAPMAMSDGDSIGNGAFAFLDCIR